MEYIPGYKAESELLTGCACFQGSDDTTVRKAEGEGYVVGIIPYERYKEYKAGDYVPVIPAGCTKARVAAAVTAGSFGIVADTDGRLGALPKEAGTYTVVCRFMQSANKIDDIIDVLVNVYQVTIS